MNRDTRIKQGQHLSRHTEFKKGQHWRPKQLHWEKKWLFAQYTTFKRSASEIASMQGCTENNIYFWLDKHGITRRTMVEVRTIKKWGCLGERNPMFGRKGILNPNWKGGLSPVRQRIYSSLEWRKLARDVRKRDKVCRLCGKDSGLEIHHIDPFSQAPLLVLDIGNVILLCEKCHDKMLGKEKLWKRKLFRIIQSERR